MKNLIKMFVCTTVFSILFISMAQAEQAPIVGKWKTIDDKTGEPKSIVRIFERDGKYYGKIEKLFTKPGDNPEPVCDKCPDDDPRKDQPTLGMEILKDLVPKGDGFSGGTILDPKEGKIYNCKLWVEEGNLMVRGYIAFFFRTQTWLPAD